jgi:hypothetical protein
VLAKGHKITILAKKPIAIGFIMKSNDGAVDLTLG